MITNWVLAKKCDGGFFINMSQDRPIYNECLNLNKCNRVLVFTPTVNNVGVSHYPEFFGNMQQQVLLLHCLCLVYSHWIHAFIGPNFQGFMDQYIIPSFCPVLIVLKRLSFSEFWEVKN